MVKTLNGSLKVILEQVKEQVRNEPAEAKHRVFLFQLFTVLGDWQRALNQLQVVGEMDAEAENMAQTYRAVIECELLRGQIARGQKSPLIFGEPEQWVAMLIEAAGLAAREHFAEAERLRGEAFELAPATSGTIAVASGGEETESADFEWIADADCRLGPLLEAVINGRYYWVPFHRIAEIQFEAPTDLRDLVWFPAQFKWANGGELVGFVPTRYFLSEETDDDAIRLAKRTDWIERGAETVLGVGQRELATDAGEYPLLNVRRITLRTDG